MTDGMKNAMDGFLHVPEQGVNPDELLPGEALRAAAGDNADMTATRRFDCGKASPSKTTVQPGRKCL